MEIGSVVFWKIKCKFNRRILSSAVSESGEEGGKNLKYVDQLLQLILKNPAEPIYMKIGSNIAYRVRKPS